MTVAGEDRDGELLERIARGDDRAFTELYRRYLPLVIRWCWQQTGNREVALDLSAEVFAAALTASRRYRRGEGSVAGWLLGIARNKLRDSRKRKVVEATARRRLAVAPAELSDADLERVEELASLDARVMELVATLPEEQRQALVARVVAERSYEEIAAELGCSQLAVRKRVSRGLRTLRSKVEEQ